MKIVGKAFVIERSWDGRYSMDLVNYRLALVAVVNAVQACFSGEVTLLAYINSEIDRAMESAMQTRKVVSLTVEIE